MAKINLWAGITVPQVVWMSTSLIQDDATSELRDSIKEAECWVVIDDIADGWRSAS